MDLCIGMINGTWLGCILIGFFWLLLCLFVFVFKTSDFYRKEDYDVYDFKEDVPMASTPVPINYDSSLSQQNYTDLVAEGSDKEKVKEHV